MEKFMEPKKIAIRGDSADSLAVTLLTVKEWLETEKVDGLSRSKESILEEIDAVLGYASEAA
jgi:hypothetical protein